MFNAHSFMLSFIANAKAVEKISMLEYLICISLKPGKLICMNFLYECYSFRSEHMRVCQIDALADGAGGTFENITLMLLQDNSHIQYQNQPEQKTPKQNKTKL